MQRQDSTGSVPNSSPAVLPKARHRAILILAIGVLVAALIAFLFPTAKHPAATNPDADRAVLEPSLPGQADEKSPRRAD